MQAIKRPVFSTKLYVDMLRQLRLWGILGLAVSLAFTILPILLDGSQASSLPQVNAIAPVLYVYIFIAPLFLVYTAFNFLTKRSASDHYHALPLTRTALFASVGAAVFTWLLGTVILTVTAAYLSYLVMAKPFTMTHFLPVICAYGTGALLVAACAMVGVSCTGTRFSAFIVTGLVLFFPRFITVVCSAAIASISPMLELNSVSIFYNVSLNIPVCSFLSLFDWLFGMPVSIVSDEALLLSGNSILYTGVLALLYTLGAGFLFARRSSETAEKAAPGKVLQHVYRCLITMPLLIGLGAMLAIEREGGINIDLLWFVIITALIVYFGYELITTKHFRNLLGALYVLPIAAIVGIGVAYGGILGITQVEMLKAPSAEQITSVSIAFGGSYRSNYRDLAIRKVEFTDAEFKQIVADSLKETIAYYQLDPKARIPNHLSVELRINTTTGTLFRNVNITPADYERLIELRNQNEDFRKAVITLPELDEITAYSFYSADLTQSQLQEVYALYRAEFEEYIADLNKNGTLDAYIGQYQLGYSFTDTNTMINGALAANSSIEPDLYITGTKNGTSFDDFLPVNRLTPKTMYRLLNYINEASLATPDAQSMIQTSYEMAQDPGAAYWIDMELTLCDVPNGDSTASSNTLMWYAGNAYYEKMGIDVGEVALEGNTNGIIEENIRKTALLMKDLPLRAPQQGEPYAVLQISGNRNDGIDEGETTYFSTNTMYYALDEATLQQLLAIVQATIPQEEHGLPASVFAE